MSKSATLIIVLTVTLTSSLVATSAGALPDPGYSYRADSSFHDYCIQSGWGTDATLPHDSMNVMNFSTVMRISFSGTCSTSAHQNVDVWWKDLPLPGSARGNAHCELPASTQVCNSFDITIDFAQIDRGAYDREDRRKTGVHEAGHTLGLDHDSISVMRQGDITSFANSLSLRWRRYSSGDITKVNAQY